MSGRPGKTSPRLLQDLLTYDPRYEERAGRNLLTDPPPLFDRKSEPIAAVPFRNCRHEFITKEEESQLPSRDIDPDAGIILKIASLCTKCFWHVDIVIDFRNANSSLPCGTKNLDWPLHHFVYQDEGTDEGPFQGPTTLRVYSFQCSVPHCNAHLRVRLRPPRFSEGAINLLTNPVVLRRRSESAKQIDPDRADAQPAKPVDALTYLGTYLADSLNPQKYKNRIPLLNRKFLKTFGRDCDGILRNLGFTHHTETDNEEPVECWYIPVPPPASHPLDDDTLRTTIIDAQYELEARVFSLPESERPGANRRLPLMSSLLDLQTALGCYEYPQKPMSRSESRIANHEEDHPYFAGLGAVGDFADSLILYSYTRQTVTDPDNATYYFECLQDIAIGRKSAELETQVQMLASQGFTNRYEVDKAYRYIGVDPAHVPHLSDDVIIGSFRARMADISPNQEEELRNTLRTIGTARHSERLLREASNAIETYSQALAWFDLDEHQPDEFVTTMYALKTEIPANVATARKAVQIIAEHRNSKRLHEFLVTGEIESGEMDVGEAYALLNINDRSSQLDLAVLETLLASQIADNSKSEAKYREAYEIVCQDQAKNHQNGFGDTSPQRPRHPLEIWPVGCKNIGNTCYLNSVLQFLFTISPLRQMVLEFENYRQECTPEALAGKRVGRSAVTPEKAQSAQEFVLELRKLFETMITAPTESILPTTRLAALALTKSGIIKSEGTEGVDLNTKSRELGVIHGLPISGPMPNPGEANDGNPASDAADITDAVMVDAQGDCASENSSTKAIVGDEEERLLEINGEDDDQGFKSRSQSLPPSRPPPVPPRSQDNTSAGTDLRVLEAVAQQQDAAEILNNVFDLLSCAVKAEDTMDDGEQIDLIKKLFFSEITTVRESKGSAPVLNTALQDHCLIYPGERDRHLYAALDDEFGLSDLDDNSATQIYEIISHPPPILIINVRRLRLEQGRPKKIEFHVGLDDVLYLDRYMRKTASLSKDELLQRREEQWMLERQLKTLETRKAQLNDMEEKMTLADTLEATADCIEEEQQTASEYPPEIAAPDPSDPHLAQELRASALKIQKEAEELDAQMKTLDEQISSLFTDCRDHPYQLHALFMHRGSATGGHYWIFIRDFQNNVWRKYNDDRVDEVEDLKDIFTQEEKYPATSTGIVYVRKDDALEFTSAVNRLPMTTDPHDVEMQDVNGNHFQGIQVIDGIDDKS